MYVCFKSKTKVTYTLKASEQQTFILRALVYGLKDEVTVLPKHLRKTETKQKVKLIH